MSVLLLQDEMIMIPQCPLGDMHAVSLAKQVCELTRKQCAAHCHELELRLLDLDALQRQVEVVHGELHGVRVQLELLGDLAHPVHDDGPVLQVAVRLVYRDALPLAHQHGRVHLLRVDACAR